MGLLTTLRQAQALSERDLASAAGVARETLRSCERDPRAVRAEVVDAVAQVLAREVVLVIVPERPASSEMSTVAVSLAIARDGFDSWKIHLMDLVDEFRRAYDVRLLLLPPVAALDERLRALMASTSCVLCGEAGIDAPDWARRQYFLSRPWFVSGMESLKAMAIVESMPEFRRNNIFVHDNFLRRA
jgi:transcriptional regulator with XRE-family HTH domain